MRNETRKILHLPDLPFSSTCARIPTMIGHAEAVHVEFSDPRADRASCVQPIEAHEGIELMDDPAAAVYPTPLNSEPATTARSWGGCAPIASVEHGAAFWCVTDNLRKGAATNAIQIAEELIRRGKLRARGLQQTGRRARWTFPARTGRTRRRCPMTNEIGRVLTAMVTPFDDDGAVDFAGGRPSWRAPCIASGNGRARRSPARRARRRP